MGGCWGLGLGCRASGVGFSRAYRDLRMSQGCGRQPSPASVLSSLEGIGAFGCFSSAFRLGCSPLCQQSLVGMIIGGGGGY